MNKLKSRYNLNFLSVFKGVYIRICVYRVLFNATEISKKKKQSRWILQNHKTIVFAIQHLLSYSSNNIQTTAIKRSVFTTRMQVFVQVGYLWSDKINRVIKFKI